MGITIKGLKGVQAKIKEIYNTAENSRPLLQHIGTLIQNEIELNFENESDSKGRKWKDTKDGKRARGDKVLHDTTRLANSFVVQIEGDSVEVGTNVPYATIHQFGGRTGKGHKTIIPPRPFVPIRKDGQINARLRREIVAYIKDKMGAGNS